MLFLSGKVSGVTGFESCMEEKVDVAFRYCGNKVKGWVAIDECDDNIRYGTKRV